MSYLNSSSPRFKYVSRFQKGRIPSALFKEKAEGRQPYLSMEYLRGQTTTPEYAEAQGALCAEDSDILLLWDGSNAGEFIWAKRGVVSSTAALARPKDIQRSFFYYLCKHVEPTIRAETVGMGIPHVNGEFVDNIALSIPPLETQTKIADYLDRKTAELDQLIAAKKNLLKLLDEKKRALIARAATRGLNPDAPLKDSGIPWLGMIPEHWEVERVTNLFRERDERGRPDLPLLVVSIHSGVTLREFSTDKIEQQAADSNTYKVALKDDISFNKMRMWQGAVGCVPCDGLVSPDYVVAAPSEGVCSDYYGMLFKCPRFSDESACRSHGIVWDRLRLYWDEFKDISVPVPPISEQRDIVDGINKQLSQFKELKSVTEKTITLLQERRTALISAAVTGKLGEEVLNAG